MHKYSFFMKHHMPLVEIIQLAMIKYRTLSKTLIQFKFKRKFVSQNYFLSHPLHMELYYPLHMELY